MLHLSPQVCSNFATMLGRGPTFYATTAVTYYYCLILVSDQVQFPSDQSGAIQYINSAVNGSNYYGGTPGNEVNCLGIVDKIPTASLSSPGCISYDGIATYTAKQTGRIGGVILTQLYGASTGPNAFFPLTSATTSANAGTYTGGSRTDDYKMYNYSIITNSVGVSGKEMIILDSLDVVAGSSYNFYGASFNFSSMG